MLCFKTLSFAYLLHFPILCLYGCVVCVGAFFPFSFFFLLALFYFALFLLACLGVALEGGLWGGLGGEEEGETVIRIYCVKKPYF